MFLQANHERNAVEEMKTAEGSGRFHYQPSGVPAEDILFSGKKLPKLIVENCINFKPVLKYES